MTPLETKIAQALNAELNAQAGLSAQLVTDVIDFGRLAQITTRVIRESMAAALRAAAQREQRRERRNR